MERPLKRRRNRCSRSYISTPAATYQRLTLDYVGGFDTIVSPSADYDPYLRIAREYPVHGHGALVAEYRRHSTNMTRDLGRMVKSEVTVLRRQRKYVGSKQVKVYKAEMRSSREYFGKPLIEEVLARVGGRR